MAGSACEDIKRTALVSDFLESAKQKLEQGLSRGSWEIEKLRRVNAKQGEINALKQQREQIMGDFSNTVLLMYRQGKLTDPQLKQFCERIIDLEREMTTKTAELEQIRAETYQAAQAARGGMGDPADTTTSGRPARPSAGMSSAGNASGGGPTPGQMGVAYCPTCGEAVRARALYCNKCGTKLR